MIRFAKRRWVKGGKQKRQRKKQVGSKTLKTRDWGCRIDVVLNVKGATKKGVRGQFTKGGKGTKKE